jgi:type II secretory pathway pseudopilin PulG
MDPAAAIVAALAPVLQQMGGLAQQLTDALNAVRQQAAAQQAAAGQAAAGAAPAVNFHRTPMGTINGIIDYESKEGKKHFSMVTAPLFSDDELFDVNPEGLHTFIGKLADRAKDAGFTGNAGICTVPVDLQNPLNPPFTNIIRDYGTMTLEHLRAYEETYIHTQARSAQDTKMLYDLLMNSLSKVGRERIAIWHAQYTITVAGVDYPAGICLFKIIVRESHLDTNATTMSIRTDLNGLDDWTRKNTTDITEVNARVRHLLDGLAARGETTHDLTVNLFKAYEAVPDKEFLHYIRGLRNGHEDGTAVITDATLMNQAANYYKNRKQLGLWEEPSEEMKQIYALEAKLRKALKDKKGKSTGKEKSPKQSPTKPAKPEWLAKNTPPKEGGMNKPREWGGRTWWYCDKKTGGKCPGMWRCSHKPSECRYDEIKAKRKAKEEKASKSEKEGETDAGSGKAPPKKKKKGLAVRMAEATQAVATQESDDSDDPMDE